MSDLSCLRALLGLSLVMCFVGCTSSQVDSISVTPATQSIPAGATEQFSAAAIVGHAGHPPQNISSTVTWTSSAPAVATISATGMATAVAAGTTTITASTNGFGGMVSGTATLTVTGGTSGTPGGSTDLISIAVLPGSLTVSNKGMTGQFLAFGTYGTAPTVRDLTNQVTWITSSPEVASINSSGVAGEVGGLATAQGYTGDSSIYAEGKDTDGTIILSSAVTFTCNDPNTNVCNQSVAHPQFATITVYNAGENETTWLVTAPSDTGTPNLIHCGPGSTTSPSVCTGTYETGSTVVLTESPTGAGFGGWSSGDGVAGVGCVPATGYTLLNSPTCTVTLTGNTSVGAIFY